MTPAKYGSVTLALESFASDPAGAGRAIREALEGDEARFVHSLAGHAERGAGSDVTERGFRYALILLRDRDLLVPALVNPAVTSAAQASRLMEAMMRVDRNFINVVPDSALAQPALCSEPCGTRLVDLIGEWASALTNWRSVTRLYEQGDERFRSKCAVLLARNRFSEQGTLTRFGEGDSRVRANIVEALWDADPSRTGAVLEQALADPNNRVAGNACLALYRAGDSRALGWPVGMLSCPKAEFRTTAAWIMGQSSDPRFAVPLQRAVTDEDARTQATAIRALGKLDLLEPGFVRAEVRPVFVTAPRAAGGVEYWIRAIRADSRFVRGLRPVDFFPCSRREMIFHYTVEELQAASPAAVRITWPVERQDISAILAGSLDSKPAAQSWALAPYAESAGNSVTVSPAFARDARSLGASLAGGFRAAAPASRTFEALLRLQSAALEQHLVCWMAAGHPAEAAAGDLEGQCRSRGISLHRWPADSSAAVWSEFLNALQARYVLRTGQGPAPVALTIRETGGGHARYSCPVRIPGGAEAL